MQLICGGAGLLLLSVLAGEWTDFAPQQVTIVSLLGMLYLALLGSVIGNTAYLVLVPFIFRYSRVVWLHLDWLIDPQELQ